MRSGPEVDVVAVLASDAGLDFVVWYFASLLKGGKGLSNCQISQLPWSFGNCIGSLVPFIIYVAYTLLSRGLPATVPGRAILGW